MEDIYKRYLLFLIGCIGIRSLLVYIAKTINIDYLPILGYLSLIPAIGFIYIYSTDSRKTGPEVFNDKIWWNSLRPIHGMLYLLFAYNAINKETSAWKFLFIDVLLGLNSFLLKHFW